jgi:5-methylcytosine-specific restriction endonuclease McrA
VAWSTSKHPGSTSRQRRQRADILARDPICYLRFDGCTEVSTEEDHVIPLHKGGDRWSYSNRRGVCHHCHSIKTQTEAQAARLPTRRATPRHPGLL